MQLYFHFIIDIHIYELTIYRTRGEHINNYITYEVTWPYAT